MKYHLEPKGGFFSILQEGFDELYVGYIYPLKVGLDGPRFSVRGLSFGNAIAAGVAGGIAYYFSNQAIFFLTAALGVPTLIALGQVSSSKIDPELARGGIPKSGVGT